MGFANNQSDHVPIAFCCVSKDAVTAANLTSNCLTWLLQVKQNGRGREKCAVTVLCFPFSNRYKFYPTALKSVGVGLSYVLFLKRGL